MLIRTAVLGTRLTDPERERILEHARRAGCTPSSYIRLVLLTVDADPAGAEVPRPTTPAEARRDGEQAPAA